MRRVISLISTIWSVAHCYIRGLQWWQIGTSIKFPVFSFFISLISSGRHAIVLTGPPGRPQIPSWSSSNRVIVPLLAAETILVQRSAVSVADNPGNCVPEGCGYGRHIR